MTYEPSVDPQAVEQTKQRIRGLVAEISALAKRNLAPEEYYSEFLQRVVEALAAVGGAVWQLTESRQLQLVYQINLQRASLDEPGDHQARHARLLGQVIQSGEGMLVPPHSGSGDESQGANPTELLLVLAPLRTEQQIEAVIEIFQRPTSEPATRRGYLRFLIQMCELANEWLKTHRLQQFSDRETLWKQIDHFARAVHDSLDLRLTCYTIANEAQRLIGCDRVSVAVRKGKHCIVEAVSGQDTFDSRSNVVTLLGKLATKVAATGEPLWFTGDTENLSPQIEQAVHDYVDNAHSKTVAVLPLTEASSETLNPQEPGVDRIEDAPVIGALIIEQIEDIRPQAMLAQRVDLVCGHSARALTHSLDYNNLFLMPLWRLIGKSRWLVKAKTLPKTVAVLVAVVATVVVLAVVPYDFNLEGRGVVQPVERRDVFVDIDGVVTNVLVAHGDQVQQGDVLVELRNTDLDVQMADLLGKQKTAEERRFSLQRLRHDAELPPDERNRVVGELMQVEQQLKSLHNQYELLVTKRKQLTIRSPITGQITTWNAKQQLLHRPVAAGQVVLTVADPAGPWELEIYMPENRMGHIHQAREKMGDPLKVEYFVATDPTTRCQGTVTKVDATADLFEEHGHSVRMLVDIDKGDFRDPRPGATATAKIYCGRRSIGYVWLHEVFEFVHSRILFKL